MGKDKIKAGYRNYQSPKRYPSLPVVPVETGITRITSNMAF